MIGARVLLANLNASGVSVTLDGTDLVLDADQEPPASLLSAIRAAKVEVIFELLRTLEPEKWFSIYTERAAIAEYDGKLPREKAEAIALAHCYELWLTEKGGTDVSHHRSTPPLKPRTIHLPIGSAA